MTHRTALATPLLVAASLLLLAACSGSTTNSDTPADPPVVVADADNDRIADSDDNCVNTPNPDQSDTDDDGIGNACEADSDDDSIADDTDNCPNDANPGQADTDGDGLGDACEADTDGDEVIDDLDQCPATDEGASVNSNGCADNQLDTDGDGVTNDVDACPATPEGQAVDATGCPLSGVDSDGDGVDDSVDVCDSSNLTDPDGTNNLDSEGNAYEYSTVGCPLVVSARDGISYEVRLASDVDGERIAFIIHEPDSVDPADDYPIIGQAHGYSGSRTTGRNSTLFAGLLGNGYGMYSMDQRGHGQSGGQIRLLDPDFEGLDMLQIVDWIGDNIGWLDFSENPDNPEDFLFGSIGLSYGGGFQHTLLRLDPQQRLDAMAPDITWYDLRYSINTNNVFKTKWALLLAGLAQSTPGGQHQEVDDGLQRGVSTGDLNDTEKALLYRSSMAYNCDGTNVGDMIQNGDGEPIDVGRLITPIPAFYTQGPSDTLFDLTETWRNYNCLRSIDPEVDLRVWTQHGSHDDLGGSRSCGNVTAATATVAFFDRHLKGQTDALDGIPAFCFNLGDEAGGDTFNAVTRTAAEGFPVGDAGNSAISNTDASLVDPISSTPIPFALSQGNSTVQNVEVYTAMQDGEVLAGIPTIDLDIQRTPNSEPVPFDGILFVGISIRRSNGVTFELPNQTSGTGTGQVTPFRDTQITAGEIQELAGITATLNTGDVVAVRYSANDPTYQNNGTREPGISVTIGATVNLPLLGVRGDDAMAFPTE